MIVASRVAGVPVIFVQHCAREGQLYIQETEAWELHPKIKPDANESIVYKRESNAFDETDLHEMLQLSDVDTVISCGLQSEHCVSNTSIAALGLGIKVIVARDAYSTWSTDDDKAETIIDRQNEILAQRGATLLATAEIVEQLSL